MATCCREETVSGAERSFLILEAIAQGIAEAMQQSRQTASVASDIPLHQGQHHTTQVPRELSAFQRPHSPTSSMQSRSKLSDEEGQKELELSEDEGMAPDHPTFMGLFRPALFKSLLFKAKNIVRMGADPTTSDSTLGLADPSELLFSEPATENEVIPSPKLFLDVVQRQWDLPGAHPKPNGSDKKFYTVAPELTAALQMPAIFCGHASLVAALASTIMSNDMEDALKTGQEGRADAP